jgi:hypothetical protein
MIDFGLMRRFDTTLQDLEICPDKTLQNDLPGYDDPNWEGVSYLRKDLWGLGYCFIELLMSNRPKFSAIDDVYEYMETELVLHRFELLEDSESKYGLIMDLFERAFKWGYDEDIKDYLEEAEFFKTLREVYC